MDDKAGGKAGGKGGGKGGGKAGGKGGGKAPVRGGGPARDERAAGAGDGAHALLVQDDGVGLGYAEVRALLWHAGHRGATQERGGEARQLAGSKRSRQDGGGQEGGGQEGGWQDAGGGGGSAEAGGGAEAAGMGYAERLWLGALRLADDCLLLSQTAQGCSAALIATAPATQRACGSEEPLRSPLLLPLVCWGGS